MTKVIPIRLSDAVWAHYSTRAQHADMPLSTYLRHRLETEDSVLQEVERLRSAVEALLEDMPRPPTEPAPATGAKPAIAGDTNAFMAEVLLLLRSVVPGEKRHAVAKELARQGYRETILGAAQ